MDVLYQVARGNGKAVTLLQYEEADAVTERGRYCLRGRHSNEVTSVYISERELDKLIAARDRRQKLGQDDDAPFGSLLRSLGEIVGALKK